MYCGLLLAAGDVRAEDAPPRWYQVVGENVPVMRSPKAEDEHAIALVAAGELLDGRADPKATPPPTGAIDRDLDPFGAVKASGPLVPARFGGWTNTWVFGATVDARLAADVPPRTELCAAIGAAPAAGKTAAMTTEVCARAARFVRLTGAGPKSARLGYALAWERENINDAPVVLVDLDAVAARKPAVRHVLRTGSVDTVRVLAMPDGRALVLALEPTREKGASGMSWGLWVVERDGRFARRDEVPLTVVSVKGDQSRQTRARLVVDDPAGPVLRLRGERYEQNIKTAAITGRAPFEERLAWNARKRAFVRTPVFVSQPQAPAAPAGGKSEVSHENRK